ncbi:hypothetical protein BDFB_009722 [Asbolus verrucosus]|nr:hypothetical protein BDFB_009722 [Asbolus verrucosus]
MASRDE